ncbi:MAG: hypothetical protein LBL90_10520 [Prevotellaceae bacterium]|jgi:hypothetical protein|nr:hypothetical protein [Prevotellaceae bacterium]
MFQYTIASLSINVSGKGLNHITGFMPFAASAGTAPLLDVSLDTPLDNWDMPPLYSFVFDDEDILCDFACACGAYLFRMEAPGGQLLLTETVFVNNAFYMRTNMGGHTPARWLRFAMWVTFGIAALSQRTVAMHASTIMYGGKSALFLGESGTGKSTHTRLWLNNIPDTELLNDDSPFLSVKNNKVFVYGSPWSGKTPCYKNACTPIAAIVRLSQAPNNKINRLKSIAALGALLPSCPPAFMYNSLLSDQVYEILSVVLQKVPVYTLECLPNAAAAQLVLSSLQYDGYL